MGIFIFIFLQVESLFFVPASQSKKYNNLKQEIYAFLVKIMKNINEYKSHLCGLVLLFKYLHM